MSLLLDTLGFAARGFIVFVTVTASAAAVILLARRRAAAPSLEVTPLHDRFEDLRDALRVAVVDAAGRKALMRARKARRKAPETAGRRVFVLDFDGDLLASAVVSLREEVTAILQVATAGDEVVLRLESPGGAVAHYGLAASQLARLRAQGIALTVCVDRVAASGGYMMACVGQRIVAAPFAILGSIGVVTQIPNVRKLLERHDVHVEEVTAGEFKRTVTVFGEVTDKGRQKLREQLDETHGHFKDFVHSTAPRSTSRGSRRREHWLGTRALSWVSSTSSPPATTCSSRARPRRRCFACDTARRRAGGSALAVRSRRSSTACCSPSSVGRAASSRS
ncbi:MAG: protease SohB [Polyangiales bacterium]